MKLKAEFIFSLQLKQEPLIWYICRNFDIVLNIIEASFSTDTGWAILVLEGKKESLKATCDYLVARGVEIKETTEIE